MAEQIERCCLWTLINEAGYEEQILQHLTYCLLKQTQYLPEYVQFTEQ